MESQRAIRYVKHVLGEGNYGYVLRKYVDLGFWDDVISEKMSGIVLHETTEFSYSRCFAYLFLEDIDLKNSFFSEKSTDEIMERGFLETIVLKISGISPFYYIERAQYQPNEGELDLVNIDKFKNATLEIKYQELQTTLEANKLWRVSYDELNIQLDGVPIENLEEGNITYFDLLFG